MHSSSSYNYPTSRMISYSSTVLLLFGLSSIITRYMSTCSPPINLSGLYISLPFLYHKEPRDPPCMPCLAQVHLQPNSCRPRCSINPSIKRLQIVPKGIACRSLYPTSFHTLS
ncbi:hypothetical protein P175DRAFT_0226263 [Aspergillus ochraceoroseus IBT 24754]|uniref:Uncharacterized protein n=1 Tax=Aspergillus ochraceoroseus IBT 24754 TaxID=1392256 RepID=A0A2T5LWK3_9EURO|nr:uncharacterized protein P175DRAFT_0226263 [Aspergillus ochraceoroseus IBT 24754]PTU20660.1 hypothetical protein P175DRAFT_0226263 [Aspergillus ochraceoroseus IBT 24754]